MSKPTKYLLLLIAAALVAWFTIDAFTQPGVQDLKGGFEEVAMYRNENNTGPVIRIYAVTVATPETAEMEQYGNYMPHTKYGNTKVYFFRKGKPVPATLTPAQTDLPQKYRNSLVAEYEKDAMGQVSFRKY